MVSGVGSTTGALNAQSARFERAAGRAATAGRAEQAAVDVEALEGVSADLARGVAVLDKANQIAGTLLDILV